MDTGLLKLAQTKVVTYRQTGNVIDDFCDRLNHSFTVFLICFMTILTSARLFVMGSIVHCWVPIEFSDSWIEYAENYCFIKNTYFVASHEDEVHPDLKKDRELSYYQWIPFFLAFQALCFYLPFLAWKVLSTKSGVDLHTLLVLAKNAKKQEEIMQNLVHYMNISLERLNLKKKRWTKKISSFILGLLPGTNLNTGTYLVIMFMFVKFLYVANVVIQFLLTSEFLKANFLSFGHNVTQNLNEDAWKNSGYFPRVTLCDFDIRALGQPREHTVECVLTMNLFYEKIFILFWFWFLIIGISNIIDFTAWLYWFTFKRRTYMSVYFDRNEQIEESEKEKFLDYLGPDGIFVLFLLSENAGKPVVKELVNNLVLNFRPNLRSN